LHYNIIQAAAGSIRLLNESIVEKIGLFQRLDADLLVELLLPGGELATENLLHFLRKLVKNLWRIIMR